MSERKGEMNFMKWKVRSSLMTNSKRTEETNNALVKEIYFLTRWDIFKKNVNTFPPGLSSSLTT